MELQILFYGEEFLRKKAKAVEEINDEVRQLVADLIETMDAGKGIGLAATQVGKDFRVFVTRGELGPDDNWLETEPKIYINPRIMAPSKEVSVMEEGCMSIPGFYHPLPRPASITIEALDLEGNLFTETLHGFNAHRIMHENDHLNGVLFIDRIKGKERRLIEDALQRIKKKWLGKKGRPLVKEGEHPE